MHLRDGMAMRRAVPIVLLAVSWAAIAPAAPEFDEPALSPTPGDDNLVYRLVHALVPGDEPAVPPFADIAVPGPDTANFPNSPFTLPKGRSYIEVAPGTFSLAGADGTPATWSWPFMIRTGLTDACELRLISQGPTVVAAGGSGPGFDGFAPLVFDIKVFLWGDRDRLWWPSVGVEAFIVTGLASGPFQLGNEPGMELLFDHRLPGDWLLEWNVGLYGVGGPGIPAALSLPNFGMQWALQKQVTRQFAAFVHGFYNAAGIPFFPSDLVVGLGCQWNVTQRLAVYTSSNWSVDDTGSPWGGISGFAYAY